MSKKTKLRTLQFNIGLTKVILLMQKYQINKRTPAKEDTLHVNDSEIIETAKLCSTMLRLEGWL